eukprot:CAMPEP_0115012072 /NCGR_PEP_ID=MMETSP0216-20121206/24480_1 /TAXON_ID=223996 /ORGANISM="Protocruzia adherens, Strain Boccale" /LENGTH=115 /DNA_ID=CAMNT_0002380981 /DNA_START=259 /DNA_END=603 /DNA_ORIENTATION=+
MSMRICDLSAGRFGVIFLRFAGVVLLGILADGIGLFFPVSSRVLEELATVDFSVSSCFFNASAVSADLFSSSAILIASTAFLTGEVVDLSFEEVIPAPWREGPSGNESSKISSSS